MKNSKALHKFEHSKSLTNIEKKREKELLMLNQKKKQKFTFKTNWKNYIFEKKEFKIQKLVKNKNFSKK